VIAYQNRIKTGVLNVEEAVINTLGAVSQPVVEQMALGVKEHFGTDAAIATSGIAGPDGGTAEKPVGTTWISVAYKDKILSRKFLFWGTRDRIIEQASYTAMQLLRRLILDLV
jgi:PncC family amidohydrolase